MTDKVRQWFKNWEAGIAPKSEQEANWRKEMVKANEELMDEFLTNNA